MSGIPLRKLNHESVNARKLQDAVRYGEYVYCKPGVTVNESLATDGTAGAGTDATDVNGVFLGHGGIVPYTSTPIGTATVLVHYYLSGLGTNLAYDDTNDEGSNGVFGGYNLLNPWRYVVGTDPGGFIKVTLYIADVSGTDDMCIGWRKYEAPQAAVDDYDEAAYFNIISGDAYIETILNTGVTVATDTTANWADLGSHTLEVQFIGRRVIWYYDGVKAINMPTFNFDSGEVIVPFWYFLNAADKTEACLTDIEIGPLGAVTTSGHAQP